MEFIKPTVVTFDESLLGLKGFKATWGCKFPDQNLYFVVLIPKKLKGFELFNAIVLGGPMEDMRIYKIEHGHIRPDGGGFVEIGEGAYKYWSLGFKKVDDEKWKAYSDGTELIAFEIRTTK
jgi:hypothetical protein